MGGLKDGVKVAPIDIPMAKEASYMSAPVAQMMINSDQHVVTTSVVVGGLAALEGRNTLMIHQQINMEEVMCGCAGANRYDVSDMNTGEAVLFINEESDCCERICCAPNHSAILNVYDVRNGVPDNTLVMVLTKPFKFLHCFNCADICRGEMSASYPDGKPLAIVKEKSGSFTPNIETMDREGKHVANAVGPTCCIGGMAELCNDMVFSMQDENETPFGQLTKKKPDSFCSALTEMYSDADRFTLELPATMPSESRAALIASSILVDYMFFENGGVVERKPNGGTKCNLCDIYCFGCLCACHCEQGGGNQGH